MQITRMAQIKDTKKINLKLFITNASRLSSELDIAVTNTGSSAFGMTVKKSKCDNHS